MEALDYESKKAASFIRQFNRFKTLSTKAANKMLKNLNFEAPKKNLEAAVGKHYQNKIYIDLKVLKVEIWIPFLVKAMKKQKQVS